MVRASSMRRRDAGICCCHRARQCAWCARVPRAKSLAEAVARFQWRKKDASCRCDQAALAICALRPSAAPRIQNDKVAFRHLTAVRYEASLLSVRRQNSVATNGRHLSTSASFSALCCARASAMLIRKRITVARLVSESHHMSAQRCVVARRIVSLRSRSSHVFHVGRL